MGKTFQESGLVFDFTSAKDVKKADKPNVQGLSAVDFIVEINNEYIFIEVKNPDNIYANDVQRQEFLSELNLDKYPLKMAMKFKDTLLKEVVSGKTFEKPVTYLILLQFTSFDANQRLILLNKIREHIPLFKEPEYKAVERVSFSGVMNVKDFLDRYPEFCIVEQKSIGLR